MSFNTDVRLKQLESLEQYISSSRDKVQSILDCLKWNVEDVVKDKQLIKCSIDPSHRVAVKNVDEHVKICSLRKEDYDLNGDFLSEPLHDPKSSIIIDDHKKIEILSTAHKSIAGFKSAWNGQDPDPKTADRLTSTFSSDERTVLYSHAVKNTVGPPVLPEFNTVQPIKSDKPLTYDERRMLERDARRRRIKYKSVHTNRRSHKEVLRGVIDGQMEMYMDWLVDNGLAQPKIESSCDDAQEGQQKSRHSSIVDDSDHCNSVISKNSTHSDSSKNTAKNHKPNNKHEVDCKRERDRHRKRSRSRESRDRRDSRERKRRRSKDRYEYRNYRRSRSRDSHHSSRKRKDSNR